MTEGQSLLKKSLEKSIEAFIHFTAITLLPVTLPFPLYSALLPCSLYRTPKKYSILLMSLFIDFVWCHPGSSNLVKLSSWIIIGEDLVLLCPGGPRFLVHLLFFFSPLFLSPQGNLIADTS